MIRFRWKQANIFWSYLLPILILYGSLVNAQDDDALLALAKKAQNPLGNVKAIMTDSTIAFDGGPNDATSYAFQFQPVYAIEVDTN